ncbi:putative reverse transcriptase domain-containing protein [Tanacetum coccineum]
MCSRMFLEELDEVEKYVGGLPNMIQGSVMAYKPKKMQDVIEFAIELMDQKIRTLVERQEKNKRKFEDTSRNNQNQQQAFKRHNVARAYTPGPGEKKPCGGSKPMCPKSNYHHDGQCAPKCANCKRTVHITQDCRSPAAAVNNNKRAPGEIKEFSLALSVELKAISRGQTRTPMLSQADRGYDVELADGRIIWVNTLIWGHTLNFLNNSFNIDLMHIEMGSFYVIIGMEWLSKYHVVIICDEKIVRIPFRNEILIIRGDKSNNENGSRLNIISCTKTQKYLLKGCHVFLAHVTAKKAEDKSEEK